MNRSIVLCMLLGSTAAALAQGTSDVMPPTPPAPAGGGPMYMPGMPAPAPAAPHVVNDSTQPAATGKERTGLFLGDSPGGFETTEGSVEGPTPETHLVRRGDTLWGVSSTYFRNPWYWPRLWALNPSITNPHWIYPGDVLRLRTPGAPPPVATPASAPEEAKSLRMWERERDVEAGVFLRQTGFVEPAELEAAGTIIGSKEEKMMLATLDEAYVEYQKNHPMQVGQRYTVYKPTLPVRHPVTGKYLGNIVEIFGEVEVRAGSDGKNKRLMKALVVDALNPMERGFRVGPLRRQFKIVEPKPAQANVHGVVVAALHTTQLVASGTLVFLDRGRKDGVEIGNRFQIIRRGDGYLPVLSKGPIDDKDFPRESIAEIVIVDLRGDSLSTGLVVRSIRETRIGDLVETKKGN